MSPIDWSQMKTKDEVEAEWFHNNFISISRKSGLFWIYDNLQVTEDQILATIELIEDESERYKSRVSFNNGSWHSNDPYVIQLAKTLGLDTDEKILNAFQEASQL